MLQQSSKKTHDSQAKIKSEDNEQEENDSSKILRLAVLFNANGKFDVLQFCDFPLCKSFCIYFILITVFCRNSDAHALFFPLIGHASVFQKRLNIA